MVEKLSDHLVKFHIKEKQVALRIPKKERENYDPDLVVDEPEEDFSIEWIYGYRGRDASGGPNIFSLKTGEICYSVAAAAILYHIEAHTQRHYMGHTEDIDCMAMHPTMPLMATGQAKGQEHSTKNSKNPHVQA